MMRDVKADFVYYGDNVYQRVRFSIKLSIYLLFSKGSIRSWVQEEIDV